MNNLHQNLQPSTFRTFIPILALFNLFLLILTFLNNLHQNLQPSTLTFMNNLHQNLQPSTFRAL